ncbi:MAG: hypothetical protein ACE5FQ_02190 [Thiogranum sp.]
MKLPVWFVVCGLLTMPVLAEQAVSVDAHGFIAFNYIDSDHNGYVSRVEARSVGAVEAAFESADIDRDGLLDRNEYNSVRSATGANPS